MSGGAREPAGIVNWESAQVLAVELVPARQLQPGAVWLVTQASQLACVELNLPCLENGDLLVPEA